MLSRKLTRVPVLHLVAGAAPPVAHIQSAIVALVQADWDVCLTLTPTAASWLADELTALSDACGQPVRTRDRRLDEPRPFPAADAYLVAPLTFNTLNKWALGISDNVALGTLNEALGSGVPVIAVPYFKDRLAQHPQVSPSINTLTSAGVRIVGNAGEAAGDPWWGTVVASVR